MNSNSHSSSTFASHHSSHLATTPPPPPFTDPRAPPCPPNNTAKLWDEYEKRAIEKAKLREHALPINRQWMSNETVLDITKSYDPYCSPRAPAPSPASSAAASPQFDFGFPGPSRAQGTSGLQASLSSIAICKTCKQSITCQSGICTQCKKTIVLPSADITTPPPSPSRYTFSYSGSALTKHDSHVPSPSSSTSSSPKRKSRRTPGNQSDMPNPAVRLADLSLQPPLETQSKIRTEGTRQRQTSLTDPNEPFQRLAIIDASPVTPKSSSHKQAHSRSATRPPSLANITTPPHYPNYSRHVSATSSEYSNAYLSGPVCSSPTTPTSLTHSVNASHTLQTTMSVWEDWDEDDNSEKIGLVEYVRGRWRGSRQSFGNPSAHGRRESAGSGGESSAKEGKSDVEKNKREKKKRLLRVVSCGCAQE